MSELDGLLDVLTGWQFAAALMAASLAIGLPWAAYTGHHTGSHGPGLVLIIGGVTFSVGVPTVLSADAQSVVFGFLGGGAVGLIVGVAVCVVMSMRWVRAESSAG